MKRKRTIKFVTVYFKKYKIKNYVFVYHNLKLEFKLILYIDSSINNYNIASVCNDFFFNIVFGRKSVMIKMKRNKSTI